MEETNKKNNVPMIVVGVIALLAVVGVAWWWMTSSASDDDTQQQATTQTTQEAQPEATANDTTTTDKVASVTIVYSDAGFEKSSYTVKKGETVEIRNDSNRTLEFSSDDHPTHTKNAELNMSSLAAGEMQQFTPETTGTWGIHDHLDSSKTTTLVVEE